MTLRTLKTLIGAIALSLFALLAAPAAYAADPCAGPFPNSGNNVYINKSGSCNITIPINVTGNVNITATGTVNVTSTITAGDYVVTYGVILPRPNRLTLPSNI